MLNWITTIPGILITCGVILLLIAIVLFILGNKKEKRTSNLAMNTGVMNQPLINDEVVTKEQAPMIIDEPKEVSMEGVNPSNPAIVDFAPSQNQPALEPEEPVNTNSFVVPTVNTQQEVNTVSENTSAYDFSISTEIPVVEETTVNEQAPVQATNTFDFSIPTVDVQNEEVKPVQPEVTIYGGNDPLANTQVVTEPVNHEPYMATTQAPIIEPVVEPVREPIIEPVVEPVREPFIQPASQSVVEEPKINVMPTISIPEIQPVEVEKEEL